MILFKMRNLTIKIKEITQKKLKDLKIELMQTNSKNFTYDEIIKYLIQFFEKHKQIEQKANIKLAKNVIFNFLDNPFEIAGPEVFKEYNYDDIGD